MVSTKFKLMFLNLSSVSSSLQTYYQGLSPTVLCTPDDLHSVNLDTVPSSLPVGLSEKLVSQHQGNLIECA